MGFFDKLKNAMDFVFDQTAENLERKMKQAEEDYKRGRISESEYSKILNQYCDYTEKYIEFRKNNPR